MLVCGGGSGEAGRGRWEREMGGGDGRKGDAGATIKAYTD